MGAEANLKKTSAGAAKAVEKKTQKKRWAKYYGKKSGKRDQAWGRIGTSLFRKMLGGQRKKGWFTPIAQWGKRGGEPTCPALAGGKKRTGN